MNARLFGALAIALLPVMARAEQGTIRNIPASHIAISRVRLYETSQIGQSGECVAFTNTSPVDAYRVLFLFSLTDIDGSVLYSNLHEAKGKFSSGTLIQGHDETVCQLGAFAVRDGSVSGAGKIGSMVASVAQVDYMDGTSWYAASTVPGASLAQADAGVRITQSFSWEPADATQECVSFTNGFVYSVERIVREVRRRPGDRKDASFGSVPRTPGSAGGQPYLPVSMGSEQSLHDDRRRYPGVKVQMFFRTSTSYLASDNSYA